MKIISQEIRTIAINAYLSGKANKKQLADIFSVDLTTINRWLRDAQKEGRLAPRPRGHKAAAFSSEERKRLMEIIKEHPDMTLQEIREHFQKSCSITTVFRTVQALDFHS